MSRKKKYNEATVVLSARVPKSKSLELKSIIENFLLKCKNYVVK